MFSFNGLDCIHPSGERARVLAEVHRVLRPGGIFYYSGHNALGAWAPRAGDRAGRTLRRNLRLLRAQARRFSERMHYLAYPEPDGTQILYSAPPLVHLRELARRGLIPLAVWGAHGARYGRGEQTRVPIKPWQWRALAPLARLSVTHPHVHYIAQKP
jgi:SAM-dependent methyltransferase